MTVRYGRVTRTLHWLTVAALTAQFVIGYSMEAGESGRGRGRGRGGGPGRGRGRGGDLDVFGDDPLLTAHVLLGVTILVLATVRLLWRRHTTLRRGRPVCRPPSARSPTGPNGSSTSLLFAMPLTGLWLVLVSDDALPLHIASHVAFFVAVAAHLGLVLKHQLLDRDHLVRRML